MGQGKRYRRISEEEKVKALKRHLVEKVAVSQLCDELGVAPNVFYGWQTRLFERAAGVFERGSKEGKSSSRVEHQVEVLQGRVRQREEALAELMSEHLALKKRMSGEV